MKPERTEQYVRPVRDFADSYEIDLHKSVSPRDAVSEELDVAILGGVWCWNQYPGIQCNNEACCYLPLLEEMGFMPSKRFADGKEIQGYCRQIGEKYGFYDKALFHARVIALRWDDGNFGAACNHGRRIDEPAEAAWHPGHP